MNRPVVGVVAAVALVLAAALVWLDARQEREYRRLLAAGDAAAANAQTVEAVEAFSGALALQPRSVAARLKRGEVYRQRGEFASAVRDLSAVTVMDPTSPRAHELLGDARAAGREDPTADYERSLGLDDQAPRVAYKLGVAHYRAGRVGEAVAALRRSIALDPRVPDAHYLLGLGLRDSARPIEAEQAFREAARREPTLLAAREELAALYLEAGRLGDAVEQLEALAALDPDTPGRLSRLALTHSLRGRHEAAVLTLANAAERHPEAIEVSEALGVVWLREAERQGGHAPLAKALEALAPIAERSGATSQTLALYGRALHMSGRHGDAERVLTRAVARFPIEPLAFRDLSEAAQALGHVELARDASSRYALLRSDP